MKKTLLFFAAALTSLSVWAAPTPLGTAPSSSTTVIALKLESQEPVVIETAFQAEPPVLSIQFPNRKITSSLPERSLIGQGAIRSIGARYETLRGGARSRYLRSLQVALSAPYPYHVRMQPGVVLIEINHPASIGSTAVEIGISGGTIAGSLASARISERFRAMQAALAQATPIPWALQLDLTSSRVAPAIPEPAESLSSTPTQPAVAPNVSRRGAAKTSENAQSPRLPLRWWPVALIAAFITLMAAASATYYFLVGMSASRQIPSRQLPSSTALIDQLAWRAFERQGYQMLSETVFSSPVGGTFRVIQKDGAKTAFFVVGQGVFLEKRTVEQIVRLMHGANLDQGIVAASAAFTVPAQRVAKVHHLTLVGREQLAELVGVGAAGEYINKQLERQQAQLGEAMSTLQQYHGELEALRQQRNEATWLLGEQRSKVGSLEAQFSKVSEQMQHYQQELERWQQEALALKKHWEESEWYLGESRARVEHVEKQLTQAQSAIDGAAALEQGRDQANWYLGEERSKRESLEARCAQLQQGLEASRERERKLEESLSRLREEAASARLYGERRRQPRARAAEAFVELLNGSSHAMFNGTVRDISAAGIGLATDRELLDIIRFRLHVPGQTPVESRAEVVWQRPVENTLTFVSGFRFLELSEDAQALLKAAIADA